MKKTVLVTGAASGIGLTCTKLLLERGAKVTAFDPQLEKMVDALGSSDSLLTIGGDVSQKKIALTPSPPQSSVLAASMD